MHHCGHGGSTRRLHQKNMKYFFRGGEKGSTQWKSNIGDTGWLPITLKIAANDNVAEMALAA